MGTFESCPYLTYFIFESSTFFFNGNNCEPLPLFSNIMLMFE